MAKLKWGALAVDGRGKLGGHVLARNRSGAYIRTKVTPNNPQSTYQSIARALLAAFSSKWRALSQVQRDAWNGAVASFSGTNVFGDLVNPTGKNLFTRLNINIANAGGTKILLPPMPTELPSIVGTTLAVVGAGASTITFPAVGTTSVFIEATPPLSPGVGFFKNKFRLISNYVAGDAAITVTTADYDARFGSPIADMKIAYRLTPVDITTGLTGAAIVVVAIAS